MQLVNNGIWYCVKAPLKSDMCVLTAAQFWNIPVTISDDEGEYFVVLFNSSSPHYRRIPAMLAPLTWDHSQAPCYYVGNAQGGPELSHSPRESVIEGRLAQYEAASLFETSFFYSKFDESQCAQ